jgi:hypothetical protein
LLTVVAGAPNVGAQNDGRDIGEFREHEFDHGAAVEIAAVKVEQGKIGRDQLAQVVVADRASTAASQLVKILGHTQ